jgi:hypothetical protein
MLLDKLKQKAAERKTREAQRKSGSDTGARARLLEVEDPKPVAPPTGKFRKPKIEKEPPKPSRRHANNLIEVEVDDVVAATDAASLCEIGGEEIWIPHSQMFSPGLMLDERGDSGTICIPRWLAEAKGLD